MEVGGCAAHFAIATSRLGLKTRLIGLVGKDVLGDYIIEKIERFEVENKVKRTEKEKTGITFAINFKDGSRSLLTYRGTNSLFSLRNFGLNEIKGKVLCIGGYNLLDGLQGDVHKILSYAKKKNMLTCLEPDLKSGINCNIKELKKNLKMVDFFFPDLVEGKLITSETNKTKMVKKILGFGCKIVALKLGEKGCLIADKKNFYEIKGLKTRTINNTGAGDFFNAGFVFDYLKYRDLRKAGMFANAAATFSLTKFDEERYPSENEVKKIMEKKYGR